MNQYLASGLIMCIEEYNECGQFVGMAPGALDPYDPHVQVLLEQDCTFILVYADGCKSEPITNPDQFNDLIMKSTGGYDQNKKN